MKVLKSKYPKGTLRYQKTDGRYIDKSLYGELDFLSNKIVKDMTFLGVCFSSTLEVGTGKSVLMTQLGEIWTAIINKKQNLNLKFTERNIVWRPEHLIARSFEHDKYSFLLVDEWEDAHYWSRLGKVLRQYFRKCRQQNLFIVLIIPNFFQLPIGYAINRSWFAIDVKFDEDLNRGNFSYYDFETKKKLYLKGKKNQDYRCVRPTFSGYFGDGYGVNKKEYLKAKKEDLKKWDEEEKNKMNPNTIAHREKIKTIAKIVLNKELIKKEGLTGVTIAKIFGISERQGQSYIKDGKQVIIDTEIPSNIIIH